MARTFTLKDSTDSVDLINTGTTGIIGSRGGFGRNRISPDLEFSSSALVDSARLRFKNYNPVTERYRLNLKSSSHDNAASQLQTLERLLRKADLFQTTDWIQDPVYIQQQTTNETNTRFSMVIAWLSQQLQDFFDTPFDANNEIDDFEIFLTREPFWRSTAPGTLPSLEPLKTPDFPYADSIAGTAANFDVNATAALAGDWGAEITIAGVGSEAYMKFTTIPNETSFTLKYKFDPNTLSMNNSTEYNSVFGVSPGTGSIAFVINHGQDSNGDFFLKALAKDDSGANVGVITSGILTDAAHDIRLEWVASSGPGNNDGTMALFFDNVQEGSTSTGLDSDTHNITGVDIGARGALDANMSGSTLFDNIEFDNVVPFVAAERLADFENTLPFISNYRHDSVLSHIFNEDNSATAFSSNFFGVPNFTYFEVSGSTPALNDAVYFGSDNPFYNLILNIGVAGNASGATLVLEYSTTTGFTSVVDGIRTADLTDGSFLGHTQINFRGASDWAKRTVNSVNKFWLRVRISALTTWTTSPQQKNEIVYAPKDTYYEINESQIHGDVQSLMINRILYYVTQSDAITWITLGAKSRGLDNFTGRLNAGGDNPTSWSETFDTDTTQTADETAPSGNNATTTFSSNQTLVQRFSITVTDKDIESDFEGTYRIYLRAKQVGGVAGDVSVQLKIQRNVVFEGETIKLRQVDEGIELIDLGQFEISGFRVLAGETETALTLTFSLFAKSDNGTTPNLESHDLVFMPIDEMGLTVSSSLRANQGLIRKRGVQIDSGLLREESNNFRFVPASDVFSVVMLSEWESRGTLPIIEPIRKTRIYWLLGFANTTTLIIESDQSLNVGHNIYVHERWISLRGSD